MNTTKGNREIAHRKKLLDEISNLADVAIFGTLSETYRTCGHPTCRCKGPGPKHGPHLNVSFRGATGKTSGYYVPAAAQHDIRRGAVERGLRGHHFGRRRAPRVVAREAVFADGAAGSGSGEAVLRGAPTSCLCSQSR